MTQLRKKLCLLAIVLLTILSSITSTAQSSSFCFTTTQLKEIAIELKSKDLLEKDTAAYKLKIHLFELKIQSLDSIVASMTINENLSKQYIELIDEDYDILYLKYRELGKENKKLKTKSKVIGRVGLPLSILLGGLTGILITK